MHEASFAHPARNVVMLEVPLGASVADFGAGSGHYALELAETVGEEGHVYAIDVQSDLLRRIKNEASRRRIHNIEIIAGDVSRPHGAKLRDGSMHLVLMSNILFQIEDTKAAFHEAHRILEPRGKLAVIDWSDISKERIGPSREHLYPMQSALRDAEAAHFHFSDEFPAGAHHYGLMFETA